MGKIKDFAAYFLLLARDGLFLAIAIADAGTFLVKSLIPIARRPVILDESWVYLSLLAIAFAIAAYKRDRDLRLRISSASVEQSRLLRRELKERLIKLKFTIERRNREPIPMDQILGILGLAKELGDKDVTAECEEIKNVLERNYDSRYYISELFETSRKDYDSVRARIGYVLDRLEKPAAGTE